MTEGEIDIVLRSPAEVAKRAIILATLLRRLWLESLNAAGSRADLDGELYDLGAWLRTEGLWEDLTEAEATAFERPLGVLNEEEIAAIAWQTEGLATLGWALGLSSELASGYLGEVTEVLQALPAPWDAVAPVLRASSLRPEAEIVGARDLAEIVEWRVRIEASRRLASGDELVDYNNAIADVVREAAAAGLIVRGATDFQIGGQSLASFDADDLEKLIALAEERLRALNWLCGFGETWDRVPLDV